ncbi:hypothetical protein RR46_02780 [Papilio xuthus]|uniref:O-acyltransferase WSD1 C-terminal domain-containing protein n=1 Tax=Papilio xuthus TaxID=66420 RepID=A0A194QBD5_PAPXU|nr:hypothetical protein RR46_02780 [Papilio xuthus]
MTKIKTKGVRGRIAHEIYTYCAFWIAVSSLPALALSYVVVRVSKHLWIKLLSSRYPHLEFIRTDTIRSLLDTHRNQGIINVLLCIKGSHNVEQIRNELYEHVIERRDKDGGLMFPRLRHCLVSCWGNYAWDAHVPFRRENHFIVSNAVYRGRPVSDSNIQDYVSEIISKYFPSDQPPWQYIVIPCISPDPKYYILVRVHHMLLSGTNSINIGDLLLIEQLKPEERRTTQHAQASPLNKLFPTPKAIPELWEKMNETMSNVWNEFISEYDPVESPRASKTLPGAFHVAGLLLVSAASAIRELKKKKSSEGTEHATTPTSYIRVVRQECKRRNLTMPKLILSPLVTADPRKWPRLTLSAAFSTARAFLKLPFTLKDELTAIREFKLTGHVKQTNTITWKYAELAQTLMNATLEAWRCAVEVYRAPAELWSDTVGADDGNRHLLQTVSLCGRKVVSWSRPIPRSSIERSGRALGVSATDVALYAATDAIRAVFDSAQGDTPNYVLTTARAAPEEFLFTFAEGDGKEYKKSHAGGMICLSLPIGATPRRIASLISEACTAQKALSGAWALQARCGALTRSVPSPLARLTLNLLSRRYAVSYAEINAPPDAALRTTVWGQTVDHIVYWRPPQANISLSLTVIQYSDTVRLAVMADARLSPTHTVPAQRWPVAVEQLIAKVNTEIARIAARANIPEGELHAVTSETKDISVSQSYSSETTLKPPTAESLSPPPTRKSLT